MTEYESQAAEKVLRHFERDFGRLIANALAQLPAALEADMFEYLQVSVLKCIEEKEHQKAIEIMRTNYGTLPTEMPDFLNL